MNRLAIAALLSISLLQAGSAQAAPAAYDFKQALRLMSGSVIVPPEWDGVWTVEDSLYDCSTGFEQYLASSDTLCAGQVFVQGGPLNFDCTGTADANSFHATCTGSETILPDCQLIVDIQVDGIRTGETYRSVTVTNASYSGTGTGCSSLPPSCTRSVTYGTRTGPAPTVYCATPARKTTWGQLKVAYR